MARESGGAGKDESGGLLEELEGELEDAGE